MKILTLILTLVLLPISISVATDSPISQIRKEYQSIRNALPTLEEESIDLSGYSTEGGVTKAYRDAQGNIRLIRAELYGESGKVIEEHYYRNKVLFFAYYEHHQYNVPFYVTPEKAKEIGSESFDPKKTRTIENRYYFDDGKMILRLDEEKKEVDGKSKKFRGAERDVTNFSNDLVAKFKRMPNNAAPLSRSVSLLSKLQADFIAGPFKEG